MAGADVNAAVLFHISLVLLLVDRACLAVLAGGVVLDSGIAFQGQVCVARVVHITVRHVVEDSAAVSLYHTRYHNSLTKKEFFQMNGSFCVLHKNNSALLHILNKHAENGIKDEALISA